MDFIRKGLSLDVLVECVNRVAQQPVKVESGPLPVSMAGPTADTCETVFVVDDEPLLRDLLVQFLSLRGYQVSGAKDGPEALSMLEKGPVDLILLDLIMSGMNGVEVLKALREKEYPGAVIILTGTHNEEALEEAWALQPQEVLSKPIDLERLLTAIQLVLVCRDC